MCLANWQCPVWHGSLDQIRWTPTPNSTRTNFLVGRKSNFFREICKFEERRTRRNYLNFNGREGRRRHENNGVKGAEGMDVIWIKRDARIKDHGPLGAVGSRKFCVLFVYVSELEAPNVHNACPKWNADRTRSSHTFRLSVYVIVVAFLCSIRLVGYTKHPNYQSCRISTCVLSARS